MQHTNRPLLALALAALLGATATLPPQAAEAQGKGNRNGHYKAKHKGGKQLYRGDEDRSRARDVRWDDDRRDDDRFERDRRVVPARRGARSVRVPPGHMPPPGLCRIWVNGVPPGRQPAPTDCATAYRNRPANARVIQGPRTSRVRAGDGWYGEARRDDRRRDVRDDVRRDDRTRVDRRRGVSDTRLSDGTRVVAARDDRCDDRNRDGVRERVTYLPPGQVPRSVCR